MLAGAVPSGRTPRVPPSPPCGLTGSGCPLPTKRILPRRGELPQPETCGPRAALPEPAPAPTPAPHLQELLGMGCFILV